MRYYARPPSAKQETIKGEVDGELQPKGRSTSSERKGGGETEKTSMQVKCPRVNAKRRDDKRRKVGV